MQPKPQRPDKPPKMAGKGESASDAKRATVRPGRPAGVHAREVLKKPSR